MELTHEDKVALIVAKTNFDYYEVITFSDAVLDYFIKQESKPKSEESDLPDYLRSRMCAIHHTTCYSGIKYHNCGCCRK